jgi:hypothetical protein
VIARQDPAWFVSTSVEKLIWAWYQSGGKRNASLSGLSYRAVPPYMLRLSQCTACTYFVHRRGFQVDSVRGLFPCLEERETIKTYHAPRGGNHVPKWGQINHSGVVKLELAALPIHLDNGALYKCQVTLSREHRESSKCWAILFEVFFPGQNIEPTAFSQPVLYPRTMQNSKTSLLQTR